MNFFLNRNTVSTIILNRVRRVNPEERFLYFNLVNHNRVNLT